MSTDPSMKRYALFHGDQFYPLGGWEDLCASFDTVEEARAATDRLNPKYTWWHVVDIEAGEIVASPEIDHDGKHGLFTHAQMFHADGPRLKQIDNKPPTNQTPPDPDALMQP